MAPGHGSESVRREPLFGRARITGERVRHVLKRHRAALLTPQDGLIVVRTELGKSSRIGPLRARFTPAVESEHGYHFEIVEVLAEVP